MNCSLLPPYPCVTAQAFKILGCGVSLLGEPQKLPGCGAEPHLWVSKWTQRCSQPQPSWDLFFFSLTKEAKSYFLFSEQWFLTTLCNSSLRNSKFGLTYLSASIIAPNPLILFSLLFVKLTSQSTSWTPRFCPTSLQFQ